MRRREQHPRRLRAQVRRQPRLRWLPLLLLLLLALPQETRSASATRASHHKSIAVLLRETPSASAERPRRNPAGTGVGGSVVVGGCTK